MDIIGELAGLVRGAENRMQKLTDFFLARNKPDKTVQEFGIRPAKTLDFTHGTDIAIAYNFANASFGRCYGITLQRIITGNGTFSVADAVARPDQFMGVVFDVGNGGGPAAGPGTDETLMYPGQTLRFPRGCERLFLRGTHAAGTIYRVLFITDPIADNELAPTKSATTVVSSVVGFPGTQVESTLNVAGPVGSIAFGDVAAGAAAGSNIVATGELPAGDYEVIFEAYAGAAEQIRVGLRALAAGAYVWSMRFNANAANHATLKVPRFTVGGAGTEFTVSNNALSATSIAGWIYFRRVA